MHCSRLRKRQPMKRSRGGEEEEGEEKEARRLMSRTEARRSGGMRGQRGEHGGAVLMGTMTGVSREMQNFLQWGRRGRGAEEREPIEGGGMRREKQQDSGATRKWVGGGVEGGGGGWRGRRMRAGRSLRWNVSRPKN